MLSCTLVRNNCKTRSKWYFNFTFGSGGEKGRELKKIYGNVCKDSILSGNRISSIELMSVNYFSFSLDERDERSRPVSFTSLSSTSAASSGPFCKIIFNNVPCEHSIFAYSYP